jgi:hypothetical protein
MPLEVIPSRTEWADDEASDFAREWRECAAREEEWEKTVLAPLEKELDELPAREQKRWRHTPIRRLHEGTLGRAVLRLHVSRFRVRPSCLPQRRARGSTRMHRARRVARTCGSRGDPHPPDDEDDLAFRRRLTEVAA